MQDDAIQKLAVPAKQACQLFYCYKPVRKYWAQMSAMAADDSGPVIKQASFE
jgi:hypothetical protein